LTDTLRIAEVPIDGYERVVRCEDPASGLHAIVSIHDTALGPALGGLRMWPYSSEEEALFDVNRLSKGMTYKSAVARTGLGGGKAVVIGNPGDKSEALYLAMGRFVDSLRGSYITAADVNTEVEDLEVVRRATRWVAGLDREDGGSGNPSPYTAYGVYLGIRAAIQWRFSDDSLRGRKIVVQGVGAVGWPLATRLVEGGATVFAADKNKERLEALVEEVGVIPIEESLAMTTECDVFAPCALGAIINDDTIPRLRCPIIAGAANNLLLEPGHGRALVDRDILYAPDYVINSGGIVNVSVEFDDNGYDENVALSRIEHIPQALRELWSIAEQDGIPPSDAADALAERLILEARQRRQGDACGVPPNGARDLDTGS